MAEEPGSRPTLAELELIIDVRSLAREITEFGNGLSVRSDDPAAVSLMLFVRLWSNFRGFFTLYNSNFRLEPAIILRSCVESAICLSANDCLRESFYPLLRGDLIATLKGQIKLWREEGNFDLVKSGEEMLRTLAPTAPSPAMKFDWKSLAAAGGRAELYSFHKHLSMTSSHVTGLSLLRSVQMEDGTTWNSQEQLANHEGRMLPMMATMAMVSGLRSHARVLNRQHILTAVEQIESRLSTLSGDWPKMAGM